MAIGVCAVFLALALPVDAQQKKKIPRIGYLGSSSATLAKANIDAFQQGLRELGYVEGKTIAIEFRFAEGKVDRLPELAAELVRSKPDLIVTAGTASARALKEATSVISIVVAAAGDLVGRGIVASLARPGGNITGSTDISPDLSGKRLELLKEIMPRAARVAVLYQPHEEDELKQTEAAARILTIQIQRKVVQEPSQFMNIYASMIKERADALLIFNSILTGSHRKELVELAAKHRLPAMCDGQEWVTDGCLVSYAGSRSDAFRRAATFVDKILKGRKPADLPVEQPTTFELVINLKTAKHLGLTIPQIVLMRADKVIE